MLRGPGWVNSTGERLNTSYATYWEAKMGSVPLNQSAQPSAPGMKKRPRSFSIIRPAASLTHSLSLSHTHTLSLSLSLSLSFICVQRPSERLPVVQGSPWSF